jgi:hypothetical protein
MSKWRSHELFSRFILARIAGIPEERVLELATGPLEPILKALPQP